jgi:hypothetical protein
MIASPSDSIERAKQLAGGTTALANKLGISKQAVSMWKRIPAERIIAIEAACALAHYDNRCARRGQRPFMAAGLGQIICHRQICRQ